MNIVPLPLQKTVYLFSGNMLLCKSKHVIRRDVCRVFSAPVLSLSHVRRKGRPGANEVAEPHAKEATVGPSDFIVVLMSQLQAVHDGEI
jgi:hypothetical protein